MKDTLSFSPELKKLTVLVKMDFLTEDEYLDILDKLPRENQMLDDDDPQKFIAKMGAEALEMLLSRLTLMIYHIV
jgi:DNA-directed RNA polymerase subunit beta'